MTGTLTKPKVEVVGIYPEKNHKSVYATYHVYLCDLDIDLRGGRIFKTKKSWFVQLPQAYGTDEEDGKVTSFPVLSFANKETEKSYREAIVAAVLKELKNDSFRA